MRLSAIGFSILLSGAPAIGVLLSCSSLIATAAGASNHTRATGAVRAVPQVRSLFTAIDAHDLSRVRKLLATGIDPNSESEGQTALTQAVIDRDTAIVTALIEAHANPDKCNSLGIQPVFYALKYPQVLEALLKHGANPSVSVDAVTRRMNSWIDDGATLLEYAIIRSSQETVNLLLKYKTDVNQVNDSGATALHFAVEGYWMTWAADHIDTAATIRKLLKAGANPNQADKNGVTPLQMAARDGDPDLVKLMLAYDSAITPESEKGRHLLALAVKNNHHVQSAHH
jgi:ankyrin repeat protein